MRFDVESIDWQEYSTNPEFWDFDSSIHISYFCFNASEIAFSTNGAITL